MESKSLSILIILLVSKCPLQIVNTQEYFDDYVPRVMNGWPAKLGDVPYQVAFKMLTSRSQGHFTTFCGGVIISPSKLVSAAHCFEEKGSKCIKTGKVSKRLLNKIVVVAGNLYNVAKYSYVDSNANGQWRRLDQMKFPKSYKFPKHDISVGFTTAPFEINANVAPIPFTTQYANYNGKCLVSGYGRISEHRSSAILLLAHLQLMPSSWCSKVHRRNMEKFICTSGRLADVGKGDSGGPLVCAGTGDPNEDRQFGILVGIVSGHRSNAGSFFSRVSSFSNFITRGAASLLCPQGTVVWLCLINNRFLLSLLCFIGK